MTHFALKQDRLNPDRRVGVEIELSGMDEGAIANTVMHVMGGTLRPFAATKVQVEDTPLGTLTIELDSAYAEMIARNSGVLRLARQLVPSEIITAPIRENRLPVLDRLVRALRHAGAEGSRAGPAKGFGVHFNPEQRQIAPAPILRVMQAYALMEPWLRELESLPLARRVLPFTDPWPHGLNHALLTLDPDTVSMATLIDTYLDHAQSRNYGLDMLPLWHHVDPARVETALGQDAPSARPTYHFRLPTSRIDEPGWTITGEWAKWQAVERLAGDEVRRRALITDWLVDANSRIGDDGDWLSRVSRVFR